VYIWRMIQESEITNIKAAAKFSAHKDYLTRVLLSPDVKHLATCSADHTAKIWNLDLEYPPAKAAAATAAAAEANKPKDIVVNGNGEHHADDSPPSASSSSELQTPTNTTSVPVVRQNQGGSASDLIASDFSLVAPSNITGSAPSAPFPVQPDGPPINAATGNLYLESTLANHQRWVWDCAFSADSAYLVTVSSDHYARLWELATGQIIRQYSGHHRGAICVALNDYSEPR
jgi:target of rapamycin complex subunit LST8